MEPRSRVDYFAYASNLYLTQMAERCPSSIFKGKGILRGYRWQINARGVANVVKSANDWVEGLVFTINAKDQKALDRSEGVRRGFYERQIHPVMLEQIDCGPLKTSYLAQRLKDDTWSGGKVTTIMVEALVYVSSNHVRDGNIREEYVLRMQHAIAHAYDLGLSPEYIERYLAPALVPQNRIPQQQQQRQQQERCMRSDARQEFIEGRGVKPQGIAKKPVPGPMNNAAQIHRDQNDIQETYGRPQRLTTTAST